MLFNSFSFGVFFPVVTLLYFGLAHRFRWALLLAASCVFYMYFIPKYILILAFTIVIDYVAGIWIEEAEGRKRKLLLAVSIVSNVGVLGLFKYFNFFNENVHDLARLLGWNYPVSALEIILPVGLSFHTFQAMSYTIEVYRGAERAERHFGIYALYVMFYPQLVAGPIERPQNLLHQFREHHVFDYDRVTSGLRLMAWGLFKKVVVADRLAEFVNEVYGSPKDFPGPLLVGATVMFAFQIYCDFSGYSDIALGSARVMGFRLMQNFDGPYHSRSIAEFWRRWHISLSTWFKDYLYVPMGGNRVSTWRRYLNLVIVFLVSGLWHGANWTYVVWGGLHGAFLVLSAATKNARLRFGQTSGLASWPTVHAGIQILITFCLVCASWVFFRSGTFRGAMDVCLGMGQKWSVLIHPQELKSLLHTHGIGIRSIAIGCCGMAVVECVSLLCKGQRIEDFATRFSGGLRWCGYYGLAAAIVCAGSFGQSQFIYFQF